MHIVVYSCRWESVGGFLAVLLWLVGLAFAHAHPLFDRFPDELAEVFDLARRFFPEFFEHGRVYRKAVGTAKTLLRSKLIFVVGCELTAGHCDDRQRTFLGQGLEDCTYAGIDLFQSRQDSVGLLRAECRGVLA